MKLSTFITVLLTGLFLVAGNLLANDPGQAVVGEKAPDFTLVDSNGVEHSLSDFEGSYVILEWLNHECPFVRKFYNAGKMQELQQRYTEQGVVWLSIISSREGEQGWMTADQINAANQEKGAAATAVLIDEPGDVGRLYNARTTPQMFIITPDGTLVYDGAIDDKPTANPADLDGAHNYVVAAMDALMNGEEIAVTTTRPYGCSVKY